MALVAVAFADDEDPDVIVLDQSNFEAESQRHEILLVEFYAPWCGHCKRLKPEYASAATKLKREDPPVPLAKVDCTANGDLCGKYGVSGYPTLKIFKGGELSSDYNGPRESAGIVSYMKSKAGPVSKELKDVEASEKFFNRPEHSVVGFFDEGSDLHNKFKEAANKLSENFRFAHTFSKDVSNKYNHDNNIVIFRARAMKNKFEESEVVYKEGDLSEFINENIHGMAGVRSDSNQAQFKKPLITVYYNVDYIKNPKGTQYWRNRVMKVAKEFVGKGVYFAVANKDEMSSETSQFGDIDTTGDAPFVLARGAKDQKYKMDAKFSMDTFKTFIQDFLADKIKPYLKSEAEPEDNDGPVKVVTASNFDKIVNDPERDVLIEFYAPWCGHCKNLEPKYAELGEKLAKEKGVTIAKMDATANDVPPNYEVRGFPTIYFAPKGSKDSPRSYNGGRETDDFIQYLAKESTDPLSGYTRSGKEKKSEL